MSLPACSAWLCSCRADKAQHIQPISLQNTEASLDAVRCIYSWSYFVGISESRCFCYRQLSPGLRDRAEGWTIQYQTRLHLHHSVAAELYWSLQPALPLLTYSPPQGELLPQNIPIKTESLSPKTWTGVCRSNSALENTALTEILNYTISKETNGKTHLV